MATKFPYLAHQIYIQLNYVIISSTIIKPPAYKLNKYANSRQTEQTRSKQYFIIHEIPKQYFLLLEKYTTKLYGLLYL